MSGPPIICQMLHTGFFKNNNTTPQFLHFPERRMFQDAASRKGQSWGQQSRLPGAPLHLAALADGLGTREMITMSTGLSLAFSMSGRSHYRVGEENERGGSFRGILSSPWAGGKGMRKAETVKTPWR